MKTIQNLIEQLKELISDTIQNSNKQELKLIPIPVRNQQRNLPVKRNNH